MAATRLKKVGMGVIKGWKKSVVLKRKEHFAIRLIGNRPVT